MSEDLAKDLKDKASVSEQTAKPARKFNFNAASAFKPGGFVPGASPYGGGQSSSGSYQSYQSYAKPAAASTPAQESKTFDEMEAEKKPAISLRGAMAGGPKKVLSIGKTAPVAPAAAAPAKTETKPAAPAAAAPPTEAPASATPAAAAAPAAVTETKAAEPKPVASESKPADAKKADAKAEAGTTADAIADEHSKLDQEIVEDMFGLQEGLKEHMSIMFMGHVDAGKSTMGGNLLYLTGAVDKRALEKLEREAVEAGRPGWYLSWVMDTNKEEHTEGKTIEVGRATFETEKRRYTILDAPGHKMYVPSMIGGASQADVGVLVISARRGEYETGFEKGGQTREHAVLAKTQGVNKLIVVVNKMDDPTVAWSEERFNECTKKLGVFLKGTGYTDVVYMPVSGFTGAGLKDRVSKKDAPWYDGPSLLEYLDNVPLEGRKLTAPFMLPVSGKSKDLGTVVEGKIESGSIRKGNSLVMMPNQVPVEVSAIYNEQEQEIEGAIHGDQVKIKLRGIEEEDIQIGFVLTSAKNPIKAVTKFEAQVAIVEVKSILTAGFSCMMHVHTAVEDVVFNKLLHKLEKGTNRKSKKPPAFAKKGMKIIAELETPEPICIEVFDKQPQLGRFTLRDQGQTIAIGRVTKILS